MDSKDPTTYSLITYAWVLLLSATGGVVNFSRKLREGNTRMFNLVEFIGEIVTSAFAGVITFWLCEAASMNPLISAALVGVSGHAGSRALFMFEKWLEHRFTGG